MIANTLTPINQNKKESVEYQKNFTLQILNKFLEAPIVKGKYKIAKIYSNNDNLCYGVNLEPLGFIPLNLSYFKKSDLLDFSASWYPNELPMVSGLLSFIKLWNDWVLKESLKWGSVKIEVSVKRPLKERIEPLYPILEPKKILYHKNKYIGIIMESLNFYHVETQTNPIKSLDQLEIIYNPQKVNQLLQEPNIPPPNKDERIKEINTALFKKYKYHILILYFINEFNKQKNEKIRHQIKQAILKSSNFELADLIPANFKNDIETLKIQIMESQMAGEKKSVLIDRINNSYYEFDVTILEKLKNLPQNQVANFLLKMAKTFTTTSAKVEEIPNILSIGSTKLSITPGELNKYVEILSSQFKNPFIEKYLFSPLFQTQIIDYFKFTRREGENIEIEFLPQGRT